MTFDETNTTPRGSETVPVSPLQMLTVDEVAVILRKTRKATYAMIERGQLPGIVRLGRSVRVRQSALLDFLSGRAPSPRGRR